MKRVVTAFGGLALMISSIGCCCSQGCQPYYGTGGGCNTCPPAGGVVYPQTGAAYGTYNAYTAAPTTASPYGTYAGYPVTAAAPMESLPTY